MLVPQILLAQSYPPPPAYPGSTAIHMDSSIFIAWAATIEVQRGYVFIDDTSFMVNNSPYATFGESDYALGNATGDPTDVVSLGDGGSAILTFDVPISNGPGFDFAVFENSFDDTYLEFAFVEVSSDGINYVRFPNHSEVQNLVQIHGFGSTDTRRINNLAGKYRVGFGTPFDLEELKDSLAINVNNVTHVKIVDVIGSIGENCSYDSFGNKINDPFSTPYESGGFDLEAVGIINNLLNSQVIVNQPLQIYPNPTSRLLYLSKDDLYPLKIWILGSAGEIVLETTLSSKKSELNLNLATGLYQLQYLLNNQFYSSKIVIQN